MIRLITLCVVFLEISGCSSLIKVSSLESDDYQSWTKLPYEKEITIWGQTQYQLAIDSLTIVLTPWPSRPLLLSVGPPIIPILPLFWVNSSPDKEKCKVVLLYTLKRSDVVDTNSQTTRWLVRPSEIRFLNSQNEPMNPLSVELVTLSPDFWRYPFYGNRDSLIDPITISFNTRLVEYEFEMEMTAVNDLTITELGLYLDGTKYSIPPLSLHRKSEIRYNPLFIPQPH
jgi:hypothetical protein